MQLHWALISLTLMGAGWRGGQLLARRIAFGRDDCLAGPLDAPDAPPKGWQGGLLGAGFCACFPLIVMQAPHTFSETPSMLALVWSIVFSLESTDSSNAHPRRAAILSGALASLGVCIRIANGPLALVPLLVLLTQKRWRALVSFTLAGAVPIVCFGLVDKLTWGGFLSSYVGYIQFNLLEGKAAQFGTAAPRWYAELLYERLPIGLVVLSVTALMGARFTWPFLVAAIGLVGYLTTQPHKEERFIIAFWPFLLIAAAGTLGGWLARSAASRAAVPSGRVALGFTNALRSTRLQSASIGLIVSAISLESLLHSARRELDLTTSFASRSDYSRGLMQAQSWVGTRKDLLGLLIEQSGGGYAWLGHSAPMVTASGDFARGLIVNPVINYAVVLSGSGNETLVRNANFVKSRTFGNYRVYRKKYRFTADSDYLAVTP